MLKHKHSLLHLCVLDGVFMNKSAVPSGLNAVNAASSIQDLQKLKKLFGVRSFTDLSAAGLSPAGILNIFKLALSVISVR
ncbi:MAG: hypothetical protein ABIN94_08165 [Ferruginibacter sp.]